MAMQLNLCGSALSTNSLITIVLDLTIDRQAFYFIRHSLLRIGRLCERRTIPEMFCYWTQPNPTVLNSTLSFQPVRTVGGEFNLGVREALGVENHSCTDAEGVGSPTAQISFVGNVVSFACDGLHDRVDHRGGDQCGPASRR